MKKVVWMDKAKDDLMEVGYYIAKENPVIAYNVVYKIKIAADILGDYPLAGRVGRVKNTRELVVTGLPYILPYSIAENEIRILAVIQDARKWPDNL